MKKNLVMVCLLVLLTSLCFAQGNKEASSTNDEVLLRLWMGIPAENGPQDVVDAFNVWLVYIFSRKPFKTDCFKGILIEVINDRKKKMAGLAGFEPTHDGTKNRCLTAWR